MYSKLHQLILTFGLSSINGRKVVVKLLQLYIITWRI